MPLDLWDVLEEGWERTAADNGIIFIGLFFVVSVFATVVSSAVMAKLRLDAMMPMQGMMQQGMMQPVYDISLPLPLPVLALLWVAAGVAAAVVMVGAIRTFVSDEELEVPDGVFTDRIGIVFLNLLVGGLVYSIVVGAGFALLVVPGIYLMVSLVFWTVSVVDTEKNFYAAMQHSWNLVAGQRLRVFGLIFAVLLVGAAVNALVLIPIGLSGTVSLSLLLTETAAAFTSVYTVAVLSRAYVRLQG